MFKKTDKYNCSQIYSNDLGMSHCRWNKLYKAQLIKDNIKYCDTRVSMGEDLNITFPVLCSAEVVVYIPKPLYNYRIFNQSMSQIKRNNWSSYKLLLEKLKDFLDENKDSSQVIYQILTRYACDFYTEIAVFLLNQHDKKGFYSLVQEPILKLLLWEAKPVYRIHKLMKICYKLRFYKGIYILSKRLRG